MYFVFTYSINLFIDIGMIFYDRFLISLEQSEQCLVMCRQQRDKRLGAGWVGVTALIGVQGQLFPLGTPKSQSLP